MSVFTAVNVGSFPVNTRDHVRFFIGGLIALIKDSSSCGITFHVTAYDHHRVSSDSYTLYVHQDEPETYSLEPETYSLDHKCDHVDIDEIVDWLYNHLNV